MWHRKHIQKGCLKRSRNRSKSSLGPTLSPKGTPRAPKTSPRALQDTVFIICSTTVGACSHYLQKKHPPILRKIINKTNKETKKLEQNTTHRSWSLADDRGFWAGGTPEGITISLIWCRCVRHTSLNIRDCFPLVWCKSVWHNSLTIRGSFPVIWCRCLTQMWQNSR